MNWKSYAKRLVSLVLCLMMVVGMVPMNVFAAEATEETAAPAPVEAAAASSDISQAFQASGDITSTLNQGDAAIDGGEAVVPDVYSVPDAQANEEDGTVTIPAYDVVYNSNVYQLANTITSGDYLVVSTNAAGNGIALMKSGTSLTAYAVVVENDKNGVPTIKVEDSTNIKWTVTASDSTMTLVNGGNYLGCTVSTYNASLAMISDSNNQYINWSYGNDQLTMPYETSGGCGGTNNNTGYLTASSTSWSIGTSASKVYFYSKVDSATVTRPAVTYGINVSASDGTMESIDAGFVTQNQTEQLTKAFWTTPTGNEGTLTGGTYAWTSSDESVATVDANGLVTYTGVAGSATIRVTYTQDGYAIWDEITITTSAPHYDLNIVDPEDSEKVLSDTTIPVKGQTAIDAGLQLAALVSYETENGSETVEDPAITWSVSNGEIASISETGKLTFTGVEGVITVTATYTDPNHGEHTSTVNISVSQSTYYTPNDGTTDFPEYPNQGAVRIDKNAQAVGNFSDTGIAQVELSMTGVPYTAGSEVDVVIMVDMSGSMNENKGGTHDDRVQPAKDAVISALTELVINEDGTFNDNRVAVYTFAGSLNPNGNGSHGLEAFTQATYDAMTNRIDDGDSSNGTIQKWQANGGTNYTAALKQCHDVLASAAAEEGYDREQFVIFVTDGEPTSGFTYINGNGTTNYSNDGSALSDNKLKELAGYTEYYSNEMKKSGVEVYSIGIQMDETANEGTILKKIGGLEQLDENGNEVNVNATNSAYSKYAQFVKDDVSELSTIFASIVKEIKQAATNVTVTDLVDEHYSLILELPHGVSVDQEFYIEVVEYELDANKNRIEPATSLEKVVLADTDKVSVDAEGNVTAIDADTFTYDAATRTLMWKADKLSNTELAIRYFVYLDKSAGYEGDDQIAAGTYPTNKEAKIEYTNHLDHQCQKYFPVPQLTWNGAQVSYTFYLVNAAGQPVNRAGRVVPFAEAVYVTDVYTDSITWDTFEGDLFSAKKIASELLPDIYSLYDENTTYTINVYEDADGVDKGNSFTIVAGNNTTMVFNTKAGTKYSSPGTYTAADVYTGFDFANTTVAFAVIWNATLNPDTVIIDYGLPVDIDVTTNDTLQGTVLGITAEKPGIIADTGTSNTRMTSGTTAEGKYGNAELNGTIVRYTPGTTGMGEPDAVYYESQVDYYNKNGVKQTVYMYSTVTVIPATTVYYEDTFLTLEGNWTQMGEVVDDATQAQDRPGENKIAADLDADNNYGFDASYESMSLYSLGSAKKASVNKDTFATAAFTFYGTGFDVIGLTSNQTGMLVIKVTAAEDIKAADGSVLYTKGAVVATKLVDTYYGYTQNASGEWVKEANNPNALYQVPVMKIDDLDYGKYDVLITASYNATFDHTTGTTVDNGDGTTSTVKDGYDLYLDAIRVYNPTGNQNETANNAYVKDNEGWPVITELRDNVIAAAKVNSERLNGTVFIDCNDGTYEMADYVSYGPNNELYLAAGQAITFNVTASDLIADVQLGVKVGNGGSVTYKINNDEYTVDTTTDMYYSIKDYISGTITIQNVSGGILSLTTIKVTYKQDPGSTASAANLLWIDEETASESVRSLARGNFVPSVPEVTVPEETIPETSVPEVEETVPENTVPENDKTQPSSHYEKIVSKITNALNNLFGKLFR